MINLIPNEEKKKMAHSFYFRLAILLILMLSFAISFAALALVPSYIISEAKEKLIEEKLNSQKSEPVPVLDQATSAAIQDLDMKLGLVEGLQSKTFLVSRDIINEILNSQVPNIKITTLFYDSGGVGGKKINISGTANSRETLLLFRRSLESNPAFKSVNLPIENFVKGSDIQFSLNVFPK
jgi:Tfp pilus assembly protein PilN